MTKVTSGYLSTGLEPKNITWYKQGKMIHNQYKVKFSGMCIMSMPSSKKKNIGMWHKKGNRCNSSQIVLLTFSEPTDEIMLQAVQLTNPHLIIDKVEWEFIGTIEETYATKTITND